MNGCIFVVSLFKVIVQIPGTKNLEVKFPVLIGTKGFDITSRSIVNMNVLYPTFTLPDIAEGMVQMYWCSEFSFCVK